MTITISGREGEGKTCVANIIRQCLEESNILPSMNGIPRIESDVAVDFLGERIEIFIREETV
jgi:thymidylate kinase